MSDKKIYVGSITEKTGDFGKFHTVSYSKEDLETMMKNLNDKGYVNLVMNERQQVSQYGQTHTMAINDWKPNADHKQGSNEGASHSNDKTNNDENEEDPF